MLCVYKADCTKRFRLSLIHISASILIQLSRACHRTGVRNRLIMALFFAIMVLSGSLDSDLFCRHFKLTYLPKYFSGPSLRTSSRNKNQLCVRLPSISLQYVDGGGKLRSLIQLFGRGLASYMKATELETKCFIRSP